MDNTASAAAGSEEKVAAKVTGETGGAGRKRMVAEVMIPRVPSDPTKRPVRS
jgi:hypothetical protein